MKKLALIAAALLTIAALPGCVYHPGYVDPCSGCGTNCSIEIFRGGPLDPWTYISCPIWPWNWFWHGGYGCGVGCSPYGCGVGCGVGGPGPGYGPWLDGCCAPPIVTPLAPCGGDGCCIPPYGPAYGAGGACCPAPAPGVPGELPMVAPHLAPSPGYLPQQPLSQPMPYPTLQEPVPYPMSQPTPHPGPQPTLSPMSPMQPSLQPMSPMTPTQPAVPPEGMPQGSLPQGMLFAPGYATPTVYALPVQGAGPAFQAQPPAGQFPPPPTGRYVRAK